MFWGHVPPVQGSKAHAIVNSDGTEKWAYFASMFVAK